MSSVQYRLHSTQYFPEMTESCDMRSDFRSSVTSTQLAVVLRAPHGKAVRVMAMQMDKHTAPPALHGFGLIQQFTTADPARSYRGKHAREVVSEGKETSQRFQTSQPQTF